MKGYVRKARVISSLAYRGNGFFAGMVASPAAPEIDGRFRKMNVPSVGRITVHDRISLSIVAQVRSDATGIWRADYLRQDMEFILIGWDDSGIREAQIFTRQTPAPMT